MIEDFGTAMEAVLMLREATVTNAESLQELRREHEDKYW